MLLEPPESDVPEDIRCYMCNGWAHFLGDYDDHFVWQCSEGHLTVLHYGDWEPDPDDTGCAHEPYDAWVERQWR